MKQETVTQNRVIYADILRVLSMIAVIVIHVVATQFYKIEVKSYEWWMLNLSDSMSRWAVPIFVMISGMFLLDSKKEITLKNIFSKYIKKYIIIILIWNLIYAIIPCIYNRNINIQEFLQTIILGQTHIWFLYMIIGLYMITPFLRKIIQEGNLIKYYIVLWLIFALILNPITEIFNLNILKELINEKLYINFVLGYTGYFLLGFYISKKNYNKISMYIIGAVGFLITFIGTALISNGKLNTDLLQPLTINVFMMGISLFLLIKDKFQNYKFKTIYVTIIEKLAKNSLGIYLIHYLIIGILSKLGFSILEFNVILGVIMETIIVFVISFIITEILSRIKILNKYMI